MIQRTETNCHFFVENFEEVKDKVLNWVSRFSTFSFLDNHQYQAATHSVECLVAAGVKRELKAEAGAALKQLQDFIGSRDSWLFGHLGYDLKNELEDLRSHKPSRIEFPDLYFFEPEIVLQLSEDKIIIEAEDPDKIFAEISACRVSDTFKAPDTSAAIHIQNRLSKQEYVSTVEKLREHILRGDCYEINFCQELFATETIIDPIGIYRKLSEISPNPFSACYRVNDQWLLCASPERFLKKKGKHILSQPIKGTSKRVIHDPVSDEKNKVTLSASEKDRSENVMVVDLVRNDLAKVCAEGTVKVDELFGIYSFPQVHQMVSTISGELKNDITFTEIIRATFPMGSMTGAPKKRVMELIEDYEVTRRGIFSGAMGYISPGGDFDFNVVIRSIMYNAASHYLSYQVGSGITFNSNPAAEWEECLMKGEAMKKILEK